MWRQLVNSLEFDRRLKLLKLWTDEKAVQLLAPLKLAEEWLKHREEQQQSIMKALKNHEKVVKTALLFDYDIPATKMDRAKKLLLSQIELVDSLFENSIQLEETSNAVLTTHAHKSSDKAPFRNKKNSEKDALIIFSTLDYLTLNRIDELHFISLNHNDFASPLDINTTIHPDISNAFPAVKIRYFSDWKQGFEYLQNIGLPKLFQNDISNSNKVVNRIIIDRSKSFLDQIDQYLNKRFKEINFLPRHLFAEQYPFLVSKSYIQRNRAFTLYTDNPELFDLVNSCKVIDQELKIDNSEAYNSVEDYEVKIKNVLHILAINSVNNIIYEHQKETQIVYSETYSCNCPMCKYSRFEFLDCFNSVENAEGSLQERFKKAYTHYKLGNYFESAKRFKALGEECDDQDLPLMSFTAKFNLHRLLIMCRNQYYGEESLLQKVSILGSVDLEDELKLANNLEDSAILEWIHSREFINEPLGKMQQLTNAIRADFFNRNSGWNENTYNLIDIYRGVENFMNANFIVYDGSSEFENLADMYLEGLFASYGCHPKLGGKLLYFSDDILVSLMHYCKADRMRHYFSRYSLKELSYKQDPLNRSFAKSVCFIMNEWMKTNQLVEQNELIDSASFKDNYSQKLFTGLTLSSFLTLDKEEINEVGKSILGFVKTEMKGYHVYEFVKCVSIFLTKRAQSLDSEILYQFFRLPLVQSDFLEAIYLDAIDETLRNNRFRLNFTDLDFQLFTERFLQSDMPKRAFSTHLICTTYYYTDNESHKNSIKGFIRRELDNKFEPQLYYDALIRNVIDTDEELFPKYLEQIKRRLKGNKINSFHYVRDYYTDPRIDEFINCWFKYQFRLDDEVKNDITKLGDYYKWILDIDGFDYLLFNPEWTWNHLTMYYKKRFRRSEKLKQELLKHIQPPFDQKLLRVFIQIYSVAPETDEK